MRTVTITFEKEEGKLTAILSYEHTSYPKDIKYEYGYAGETVGLTLAGKQPGMLWPLNDLQKHV